MLISSDQINEPYNYLNDLIGVFDDSHQFSDHELTRFNFLNVNGSVVDVNNVLKQIRPVVAPAFKWVTEDEYRFDRPDSSNQGDVIEVWQIRDATPNRWYKLVNDFKFPINTNDLTPEEKQLMQTYDITHPSVGSFIKEIAKSIGSDPANNDEIRDLRNSYPPGYK